jgi:hypothetical protein
MRDRQPNGNIGQIEVLEATCSSTQVPTSPIIANSITPDPMAGIPPTYYGASPSVVNNIPPQEQPFGL